jgi:hypothetical protein
MVVKAILISLMGVWGICLWRGRRWPLSKDGGETGPDEAGIQQQTRLIQI